MEKFLLLKGCAGLGNRLFSLFSAIHYAEKTNRKFIVDWRDGLYGKKGDNIFPKYFKINHPLYFNPENIDHLELDKKSIYPESIKSKLREPIIDEYFQATQNIWRKFPKSRKKIFNLNKFKTHWSTAKFRTNSKSFFGYLKSIYDKDSLPLGDYLHYSIKSDVVLFVEFTPLFRQNYLRYLELSDEIQAEINKFCMQNNISERIGIHVRNTDMKPTRNIGSLIAELKTLKNTDSFFLASDDIDTINLFKKELKDVVTITKFIPDSKAEKGLHKWALQQNSPEHAELIFKESLIDMMILAKSKYIVYQGNSSFSNLAVALNANKSNCKNWLKEKISE